MGKPAYLCEAGQAFMFRERLRCTQRLLMLMRGLTNSIHYYHYRF